MNRNLLSAGNEQKQTQGGSLLAAVTGQLCWLRHRDRALCHLSGLGICADRAKLSEDFRPGLDAILPAFA